MKAARVLPWARPGRSWKKETLNIGTATGAGMAIGSLVGGKKGATIGAVSGGFARWLWWWAGR